MSTFETLQNLRFSIYIIGAIIRNFSFSKIIYYTETNSDSRFFSGLRSLYEF